MNCTDFHQPTESLLSEGKLICILGPNKLQNSLMASALEPTVGAKCFVIESLDGSAKYEDDGAGTTRLVLWDRFGKNAKECLSEYEANAHQMSSADFLAFFNLSRGLQIEEKIVPRGVHGFFYLQDSLELIARGITAIFKGQLWVSREIMAQCIGKRSEKKSVQEKTLSLLTDREKEVLAMVASGLNNTQIAEKLFISPHTVKTHLYNLFKKIDVPNRLQATFWYMKNF